MVDHVCNLVYAGSTYTALPLYTTQTEVLQYSVETLGVSFVLDMAILQSVPYAGAHQAEACVAAERERKHK